MQIFFFSHTECVLIVPGNSTNSLLNLALIDITGIRNNFLKVILPQQSNLLPLYVISEQPADVPAAA